MAKKKLKEDLAKQQGNIDAVTGEPLSDDTSEFDEHRAQEKASGGPVTLDNTMAIRAVTHQVIHGNWRERPEELEEIKALVDDREQIMKSLYMANNRLLAYRRRVDHIAEETQANLETIVVLCEKMLDPCSKSVERWINNQKDEPLIKAMLGIPSLGPQTIAYILSYIIIEKAQTPSALWKYVGLHCASHERYVKGEKGGGNKRLRTALYRMAESMMKNRECPYRDVYDRAKLQKSVSEKMIKTRNTEGKWVEVMWKDAKPSHRHGHALRLIIKAVLGDLWFVWREIEGLPTRSPYVEEKLGHTGIVRPEERGWKWEPRSERNPE